MRLSRDSVLAAVRENPGLCSSRLADLMGASPKATECHLYRLRDVGLVQNRGSVRGGGGAGAPVGGPKARAAWHIAAPRKRVASVFDLG